MQVRQIVRGDGRLPRLTRSPCAGQHLGRTRYERGGGLKVLAVGEDLLLVVGDALRSVQDPRGDAPNVRDFRPCRCTVDSSNPSADRPAGRPAVGDAAKRPTHGSPQRARAPLDRFDPLALGLERGNRFHSGAGWRRRGRIARGARSTLVRRSAGSPPRL